MKVHFFKEDIQKASKYMKRSFVLKEMQMKTAMTYHFALIGMVIYIKTNQQKQKIISVGEDVEE